MALFVSTIWPAGVTALDIPVAYPLEGETLQWLVTVKIPRFLRQGDRGKLAMGARATNPAATGGVYPLEVKLEISGLPGRERSIQTLINAKVGATFDWEIQTDAAGEYSGKVWMWMGSGDNRQALLAAPVEITVVRPLGLPTWLARWTSAAGSLLAGGLAAGQKARKKFLRK